MMLNAAKFTAFERNAREAWRDDCGADWDVIKYLPPKYDLKGAHNNLNMQAFKIQHPQIAARAQAPPRHRNSNRRHIRTTSPAKRKKSSARQARRRRYSAGQDQVAENGRRQARGRGGTKHRTPPTEGADCRPVRFGSGQLLRGNRPGGKGPRVRDATRMPGQFRSGRTLKEGG